MPAQIPESHLDLVTNPNFATVGTVKSDGQPHLTVIWCTYEDGQIKFSTTESRQKADNLDGNPQVSLLIIDPENGYRYLEVRGTATISKDNPVALIDRLAKEYRGLDSYYANWDDPEKIEADRAGRIIVSITPEHVVARG